jgi:hypothetical protein
MFRPLAVIIRGYQYTSLLQYILITVSSLCNKHKIIVHKNSETHFGNQRLLSNNKGV